MSTISKRTVLPALATVAILGLGLAACDDDEVAMPGPGPTVTFEQVDRFGLPAVNTVFIPSGMKDAYNTAAPADDAQFRDEVVATLMAFGQDQDSAEGLADAILPDIQPIDLTQPSGFLNGRRLQDDVVTAELMLIFGENSELNDDNVDANDRTFPGTFPYLAAPHQ